MTKKSVDWRSLEQFAFGDGPELANELASLVLAGKKRATCWAASEGDEALAFDEGEGDCTLAYWRRAHQSYFTQQGTFAPDMLLYCEHFRLVAIIPPDQLKPSGAAPADGR